MPDSAHSRSVAPTPPADRVKIDPSFDCPSDELAALVMRLRGSRSVYRVGSRAVPKIEWIAAPGPGGPIRDRPSVLDFDPRPYVRDGTLQVLETGHPVAYERVQRIERTQLR